jgi:hypothetical protein
MTWILAPIREAVRAGKDALYIRELIAELMSSGVDRDEIFAELTDFKNGLRSVGDERSEDLVADVMDFFVGWCAPANRL